MDIKNIQSKLESLKSSFAGEIMTDDSIRLIYATDASAYRELPLAVAYPKNKDDIRLLIRYAAENNTALIPRAAGTSLAGQVVGKGIIVDVSKYMTRILELNTSENWVWVEPGVILDELNQFLAPHGLFFGPETSTSNRCMMGGMLGNNACGSHSLVYGSTRDHTLEVQTLLSDGSEAHFRPLSGSSYQEKLQLDNLEGVVYRNLHEILANPTNQQSIREAFPDKRIKRRNTGYAIDLMLDAHPFTKEGGDFNFSRLLAGSEGTLAFTTAIKLNLVPLPPKNKALLCVHLNTVGEATRANLLALQFQPVAVELMDASILELTKGNIEQNNNRFFLKGDPGAMLIIEFAEDDPGQIDHKITALEKEMRAQGYGYHFPVVRGKDMQKVWNLRKAGLGVLSNMPGDAKPVAVTEDTAVHPEQLPDYIADFAQMMATYGKSCTYHAHIATGELHLRPVLNLKDKDDVDLFHQIAYESALLVKKYRGSLSGEHGDGRLRGEFIPLMIGAENYKLLQSIKKTWDPAGIFNPGKITDTPPMNTSLRYEPGAKIRPIDTVFDFSPDAGILAAVEKCNGAAACRKTELIGGTMCPSYMASRDERQTTRARANVLREFLTNSTKANPFDHKEVYEVMDLCLSCKACKSECPSSVDVAKLKAEFLEHYHRANGIPLRSRMIAYLPQINRLGSIVPALYNMINHNRFTASIVARIMGFAPERRFPLMASRRLEQWYGRNKKSLRGSFPNGRVYLFNDEFTRYNDTDIGIKAIRLLSKLGYEVVIPEHIESARTFLSKGLVLQAKKIARRNVHLLKDIISAETPLVGIEPSAILGFRDEYPELVGKELQAAAKALAKNALMIDEFLAREAAAGRIRSDSFTSQSQHIKLHGHCHQKSLSSTAPTLSILSLPEQYTVEEIPSGCCGMAGSFGFEKEHYALSMKVGELVLFPEVRNTPTEVLIAAPGTSCRHQIKDGTRRRALHPVEILFDALK